MAIRVPRRPPHRPRERGQATVETVGIIVAIALLLAATGAWMSGTVSLPNPPDLIGAITRVFGGGRAEPEGRRPGLDVPGAGGYVRLDHGFITPQTHPPIGRAITAARHGAVAVVRVAGASFELPAACAREFEAGFAERVRERALALARDPRELLGAAWRIVRHPDEALDVLPNPMGVLREVGRAWSMNWRERALYLSRLSGRAAADFAVDRLTQGTARVVGKAVGRLRATRSAPAPPRGEATRGRRAGGATVPR
jgi:hypothetical protein